MSDGGGRLGAITHPGGDALSRERGSPKVQWLGRAADTATCALALGPFASVLGADPTPTQVIFALLGTIVLAVLAVYHLRLVRGGRRRAPLAATLSPLFLASYGLMPALGEEWLATPAFPLAAVLASLPGREAWPIAVAIVVAEPVVAALAGASNGAFYGTLQITLSAAILYGFARAVAAAQELARLREELATVAVMSERLRVSRDLHDLLGRSLAAIGLKAELAVRYQEQGAEARVTEELGGIVELAHQSGADLRELVSGYRRMTLEQEVRASRDLLQHNSVTCTVDLDALPTLPRTVDQVLAWTVREAVTNVLRHSAASRCVIEGRLDHGYAGLRVRNDGVPAPGAATTSGSAEPGQAPTGSTPTGTNPAGTTPTAVAPMPAFTAAGAGTGLMGIAERAAALGGSSQARKHNDGWFEVAVRVPIPQPAGMTGANDAWGVT